MFLGHDVIYNWYLIIWNLHVLTIVMSQFVTKSRRKCWTKNYTFWCICQRLMNTQQIYIKSKINAFSALKLFNINACSCNENVSTNLNVLDAWYNEILDNIMYATTFY
jgi:hypothetical protein